MKTITLDKTALKVSEVCLGGDVFGSKLDRDTTFRVLDRFREGGGSFIDTANVYSRDWANGYSVSERLLGEYLNSRGKDSLIIATKGAHPNPRTMHTPRINKTELERDIDESLRSLGLERIDFYYLHRDDPSMPIGEILELMEDFVRAGKIRYYGGSNYSAGRIREAGEYAREKGIAGFSGISNMWSPAEQNAAAPLCGDDTLVCFTDNDLPAVGECGIAFLPYNSTAKGWFAKRAAGAVSAGLDATFANSQNLALLEKLKSDAAEGGISVQTALLRHIRSRQEQIVPITSVSRIEQLDDILMV